MEAKNKQQTFLDGFSSFSELSKIRAESAEEIKKIREELLFTNNLAHKCSIGKKSRMA